MHVLMRGAGVAFLRMAALNHPSVPQDNNGRTSRAREGAFQLDATTTVCVCGCEAGMGKFGFVPRRIGIVTTSTLPWYRTFLVKHSLETMRLKNHRSQSARPHSNFDFDLFVKPLKGECTAEGKFVGAASKYEVKGQHFLDIRGQFFFSIYRLQPSKCSSAAILGSAAGASAPMMSRQTILRAHVL